MAGRSEMGGMGKGGCMDGKGKGWIGREGKERVRESKSE